MQIARLPDIDEGTWEDVKKYVEGARFRGRRGGNGDVAGTWYHHFEWD